MSTVMSGLCGAGDQTQSFVDARQPLYQQMYLYLPNALSKIHFPDRLTHVGLPGLSGAAVCSASGSEDGGKTKHPSSVPPPPNILTVWKRSQNPRCKAKNTGKQERLAEVLTHCI